MLNDTVPARPAQHPAPPPSLLMTIHRLSQGGADRVAILLVNGFAAAGYAVDLLVLRDGGEAEGTLLRLLDRRVSVVSAGPAMGSRHLELFRGWRRIQQHIDETGTAIVVASSSNMGLVTGLVARCLRARSRPRYPAFVMKLTNPVLRPIDSGKLRKFYRRTLYRLVFGSFDRVLVLTEAERAEMVAMYPQIGERFVTVANPYLPSEDMVGVRMRKGSVKTQALVLSVARMMPQKRLDRLLRAFALLDDGMARLIILGDGPERLALEQLAHSLEIADRVEMPGFVEDVVPWLRKADLLALSSDYEGLPAVVFEALACDVPVVTTDSFAGASALLSHLPRCAVVGRENPNALAAAMRSSLAQRHHPADLRDHAKPYAVETAIAAHVATLEKLEALTNRRMHRRIETMWMKPR